MHQRRWNGGPWVLAATVLAATALAAQETNLLEDGSFELPKERDRFGLVFVKWGGWKYEGECEFRVGQVARTGQTSGLLMGGAGAKIRTTQQLDLEPGRYRITAYLRGLDIGTGLWNMTTEFMFDGKYMPLHKNGTFGWTKLTYVADLTEKRKTGPSFGMMASGYFWIDDVSLVRVGPEVALTDTPVMGVEEAPLNPPGDFGPSAVRCAECGYRNQPEWKQCYACGTALAARATAVAGPSVKLITSFEEKNPFDAGTLVEEHATDGRKALRLAKSYASMSQPQDWSGYDFLKADLHTDSPDPLELYVEIRDTATQDYWTRVNYVTVVPPGSSTLIIPVKQLYVGEKSRPGRMLLLPSINRFVLNIGDKPAAPLFIDHLRLERDEVARSMAFDGLYAFDLGTGTSPVMEGFTQVTAGTLYSKGRGYGLKEAKVWRSFDALQPDPLYQDFICLEQGGLAVDLPNGRYRVFVNLDSPSGFWGEYQVYRKRTVLAEGQPVVSETMDFPRFKEKYFRFWNGEDFPADNTFDKYQKAYFQEKTFEVEVTDGQLNLEFQGENWACSVSAVVVFPVTKAEQGAKFLQQVEQKRRFYFDNYFKRILHRASGDPLRPSADDTRRGYVVFSRDSMKDIYYNDTPLQEEIGRPLAGEAFPGEAEPLTVALVPLRDLGRVAVTAGPLTGPAGTIPASALEVGFVSYRLGRVTMEGSVYTISPRLIMPTNSVAMPKDCTRRFWLTVKTPETAQPGLYQGQLLIQPERGHPTPLPLTFRVRSGKLDPLDIPAGPWGYAIGIPWQESDPAATAFNDALSLRSLHRLRDYGFTTFSGVPTIAYRGFKNGQPVLDFTRADRQMRTAKDLGFLAVVGYGAGVGGLEAYFQDTAQMNAAGFKDYAQFVKAIYSAVQQHADSQGWIPVYYNLGDEPLGEALTRSAENAAAYHRAFPQGPPYFTAASSFTGTNSSDPHFRLSKALSVANWNNHDEASVKLLHAAGGDWAFYNGGNRWTFGTYMYKAAHEFGMKFRISWHWNATAGDPYYALDCREDDYAWCNASPAGQLIPAVHFEQLRSGLNDYRRLLTLARLAREKATAPAAAAATALLERRLSSFHLGQRDHDALFPSSDWADFRRQLTEAIEALGSEKP